MFRRLVNLVNIGIDASLSEEQARFVRLCNQSTCIIILSALLPLVCYVLAGSRLLIATALILLLIQFAAIGLNHFKRYTTSRLFLVLANVCLIYLFSTIVGEESYFFLYYMLALLAPFALFPPEDRWAQLFCALVTLSVVVIDMVLNIRLVDWSLSANEQALVRALVIPIVFVGSYAFVMLLLRENQWAERTIHLSNLKLETLVTSLNDTVFEINDRFEILNVWCSEDARLPHPRSRYLTEPVTDFLPPELVTLFREQIGRVFATGERARFEYQSPTDGLWYKAKISILPVGGGSERRVSVVLQNIHKERAARQRMLINDQIIQDNHDAILYLDRNGRIQSCNQAAERLYGYLEEEMQGQSIGLFRITDDVATPDILQTLAGRDGWSGEILQRRRDGRTFDVLMTVSMIRADAGMVLGYALICRDISAARAAQELLRRSEWRFKSMAEHVPGVVYEACLYLDGRPWHFNYVSPRVRDVLGLEQDEDALDLPRLLANVHPEDFDRVRESALAAALQRQRWDCEARFLRKEGTVKWIHGYGSPIEWDETRVVFHGILMDVTAERTHSQELTAAKEKAEEGSQAKAEFLSVMSHEIRTPMNAIIGLTHMLLDDNPRPEQVENLSTLKFSAENLLSLINDILDFNKIEAGRIELEQVDFDLFHLLDSISRTASYAAREKGLEIREKIDRQVPRRVLGDPTRLAQILSNLLSNAVKFTHQGLVELCVRRLDATPDPAWATLEFRVTDTGIGIAEDKLDRIFEYFTQADESITRSYGGTGLGLAITKALVELFGSEIRVQSDLGSGSSFHFTLRLACHQTQSPKTPFLLPVNEQVKLDGRRILLVEDNPVNVMVAEKLLRKWGAEVDTAENGFEAVEAVIARSYDLVLMDIQMPLKDGYAATREIRALGGGQYQRLPIIALSAATTENVQREAVRAGMDGFLTKPINPGELKAKILRYLQALDSLTA